MASINGSVKVADFWSTSRHPILARYARYVRYVRYVHYDRYARYGRYARSGRYGRSTRSAGARSRVVPTRQGPGARSDG